MADSLAALTLAAQFRSSEATSCGPHERIYNMVIEKREVQLKALLEKHTTRYMSLRAVKQAIQQDAFDRDVDMAMGPDVDTAETMLLLETPAAAGKRKRTNMDPVPRLLLFVVPPKGAPRVLMRCRHCSKSVNGRSEMINHVRTHTGAKPHACKFEGCNKSFAHTSNLRQHERSHTKSKPYSCHWDGCTKAFAHSTSLKEHLFKHEGIRPYQCNFNGCSKSFDSASNLNRHMKSHNKGMNTPWHGNMQMNFIPTTEATTNPLTGVNTTVMMRQQLERQMRQLSSVPPPPAAQHAVYISSANANTNTSWTRTSPRAPQIPSDLVVDDSNVFSRDISETRISDSPKSREASLEMKKEASAAGPEKRLTRSSSALSREASGDSLGKIAEKVAASASATGKTFNRDWSSTNLEDDE
jgi:hypothetical protein